MHEDALIGLAGEVVRICAPQTEADPAALLLQFLAAFGNAVGRSPCYSVNADEHRGNLFVVLVGPTSAGRKGTSWSLIRELMRRVDPDWTDSRVLSGMSTGEGLIWAIRDEIRERKPFKKGGQIEYQDVITDPGVKDKRLFVLESEFSRVLKVSKRDGNTLSALMRLAWDGQKLQTMTKNSPATATEPHVSIVAHITKDELLPNLDETEMVNGLCNRFLWICTKRSQFLPDGGTLPEEDLSELAKSLRCALASARKRNRLVRDDAARVLWHEQYARLAADIPGMRGALLARAAPIVLRLSLIYALLDGCSGVREDHVRAALAVWAYSANSVTYIFGDRTGNRAADAILATLRAAADWVPRTELSNAHKVHANSGRFAPALDLLKTAGLAKSKRIPTGGRDREVWRCV